MCNCCKCIFDWKLDKKQQKTRVEVSLRHLIDSSVKLRWRQMSDAQSVPIRLTDFDLNSNDCSVHWLLLFFWLSSVCCSSTNSNFSTFRDPKKGVRTRSLPWGAVEPAFFCCRFSFVYDFWYCTLRNMEEEKKTLKQANWRNKECSSRIAADHVKTFSPRLILGSKGTKVSWGCVFPTVVH